MLNIQNLENSPRFPSVTYTAQRTNGLEDTEFCASAKLLKTELHSTSVGRNKIPKLSQN
jgi:hypothetical protein